MTPRRETRWEYIRDTLRFVAAPRWTLIPVVLIVAGAVYLVIQLRLPHPSQPTVTIEGRIVRFGPQQLARQHPPAVAVIVRSDDGTTKEITASPTQIASCRAGDHITYTSDPEGVRIDRCTP